MELRSFCVFGVIVVLGLAGNIQSIFLSTSGSTKPTQRNQEERQSHNMSAHIMMCVHIMPQPNFGTTVSPKRCADSTPSKVVPKHSKYLAPHIHAMAFRMAWKPCWPQGTFWKRMDAVKYISDKYILEIYLRPLAELQRWAKSFECSRHWGLPAQQFLVELYKTRHVWRFLPRNHRG